MKTAQGYTALVTGASQGLGRALAEECAGRGMNLVLVALPDTGMPEVATVLERGYGVSARALELDLTADDAADRIDRYLEDHAIAITHLINNAGVGYNRRFEDSTLAENEATIRLNVLSLVKLTHRLLPSLQRAPRAYILNIASLGAYFPTPYMPVYSPTKSFVLNFSLSLREELAGSTVSVSVACPNGIRTNRYCREQIELQGFAGRITCRYPDEVAREAMRGLLKGRAIIIPGIVNRVISVIGRLVPRRLIVAVISSRWGEARRPRAALAPVRLATPAAAGGVR